MTPEPHHIDIEVGKRIRARRIERKMSQSKLAFVLGLTFQQIQKYENASNRVSASKLWEISNVLGVKVSYFFPG